MAVRTEVQRLNHSHEIGSGTRKMVFTRLHVASVDKKSTELIRDYPISRKVRVRSHTGRSWVISGNYIRKLGGGIKSNPPANRRNAMP